MSESIAGKPHLRDFQQQLLQCLKELDEGVNATKWAELRRRIATLIFKPEAGHLWRSAEQTQLCMQALDCAPTPFMLRRLREHLIDMAAYVSHNMLQQTIPDAKNFAPVKAYDTGSLGEGSRAIQHKILNR